jgi:putative spermidine/putrescine transport system substrate-binding protein
MQRVLKYNDVKNMEVIMDTKSKSKSKLSRRSLLKGAVATSTAVAASTLGAPMIWAQSNIVLRQSGTGVSAFNEIAKRAKEDLGITMEMTALDSDSVAQKVAT